MPFHYFALRTQTADHTKKTHIFKLFIFHYLSSYTVNMSARGGTEEKKKDRMMNNFGNTVNADRKFYNNFSLFNSCSIQGRQFATLLPGDR